MASVLRDVATRGEPVLETTAELTDLRPDQVQAVARYYAEFKDEIDAWIARNDAEAREAEAAWAREQHILGG